MEKNSQQIEMMKKFIEEKKKKGMENSSKLRPPKSTGRTNTKHSTKGAKIGNGGGTFDK